MTTRTFNLANDGWIPVTDGSGNRRLVGLLQVFSEGERLRDLAVRPHERIALMRLLICIASRAEQLNQTAQQYLSSPRMEQAFSLFGETARFLQLKPEGKTKRVSAQKLNLVNEDSETLFAQHLQVGGRLREADLALALLTYQSFAAGGRVEGCADSQLAGLCRERSAIHAFLAGTHLAATLRLNMLSPQQVAPLQWKPDNKPLWEFGATKLSDLKCNEQRIVRGYLERLVPLTRALWIHQETLAFVDAGAGLRYPLFVVRKKITGFRETTTTTLSSLGKKGGAANPKNDQLLSATAGGGVPKALWRQLHAIAILRRAGRRAGPTALQRPQALSATALWAGALVGDQAKVGDTIESVFPLPRALIEADDCPTDGSILDERRPNQAYRNGIAAANTWAGKLSYAVACYRRTLRDELEPRKNKSGRERGGRVKAAACSHYWTLLEQQSPVLVEVACEHSRYIHADKEGKSRMHWPETPWWRQVLSAARTAFEHACPRETPAQLRAYAAGLKMLFDESKDKAPPDPEDNSETNE